MPRLVAVAAVSGALLLPGCGFGSVDVAPHTPVSGTEQECADLVAALPEVVSDAVRRDVDPPSAAVAAWGQPPVILRCGVSAPTDADPSTTVLVVDGVGWLPVRGDGGTFFSTVDRVAVVEVAVPDDYEPPAEVLVDLAPAVRAGLPEAEQPLSADRSDATARW